MRHKNKKKYLGKNSKYRKSMFANMLISIIKYEIIKTTVTKSKTLRQIIEPLITLAKTDSIHNRRLAKSKLHGNLFAVNKLFKILAPRFQNRPGGYVQIFKCGFRKGDCAPMGIIKFVEKNTI